MHLHQHVPAKCVDQEDQQGQEGARRPPAARHGAECCRCVRSLPILPARLHQRTHAVHALALPRAYLSQPLRRVPPALEVLRYDGAMITRTMINEQHNTTICSNASVLLFLFACSLCVRFSVHAGVVDCVGRARSQCERQHADGARRALRGLARGRHAVCIRGLDAKCTDNVGTRSTDN